MPKLLHREAHNEETNWRPLSEVMTAGTPYLAIHPEMTAPAHASAEMEARGTTSNHLLALSIIVSKNEWPSFDTGRGPTRSMWMWENNCLGTAI